MSITPCLDKGKKCHIFRLNDSMIVHFCSTNLAPVQIRTWERNSSPEGKVQNLATIRKRYFLRFIDCFMGSSVAQLVERLLPIPEVRCLNPVIGKKLYCTFTVNCIEKTKFKKKRPGMAHSKLFCVGHYRPIIHLRFLLFKQCQTE